MEKITDHNETIETPEFDALEVYEKEIAPKLDEVANLLKEHKVPFVFLVSARRRSDTFASELRASLPGARTPVPLRALAYLGRKLGDPELAPVFSMIVMKECAEELLGNPAADEQAESRELVDQ